MKLTSEYWDCKKNYIRHESENKCRVCNAERDEDHPDSRVNEVEQAGFKLNPQKIEDI